MRVERSGVDGDGSASDRGLSSVIGLVVLVGIVAVAATSIAAVSGDHTGELRDRMTGSQAETAIEALRGEVGSVVEGAEEAGDVAFPGFDDEYVRVRDRSRIEVVVEGSPGTCTFAGSLGSLRYRTASGVLAYEANGIFRLQDGNSVVVTPPDLSYRTTRIGGRMVDTLDVPALDVRAAGSGVGGDEVTVVEDSSARSRLCAGQTPLQYVDSATVRIENSDFYEAWYDYLVEEFGRATKYDANRTVVVRSVHLGEVGPGTDQSMGPTRRTGKLLHPYDNSSYEPWTIHEVNWEVGTGTRSITGARIDYADDSVDLRHVDEEDVRVFYVSSTNLWNYDPTHNRTPEIADVRVEDDGTTLYVEFEEDLAGNGGGTGANAHFIAQYRNVRNPRYGGNYSVNVSLNGDTREGGLNVTGPTPPGTPADPSDGLAESSNTYVISVDGARVIVCDDGDAADECEPTS